MTLSLFVNVTHAESFSSQISNNLAEDEENMNMHVNIYSSGFAGIQSTFSSS